MLPTASAQFYKECIWYQEMIRDGVAFTHGSNSESLEGVAKFRAILSMEKINDTPWFYRNGPTLPSGERFFTIKGLETNTPVSISVSMMRINNIDKSIWLYAQKHVQGIYPVIYGIDKKVRLHKLFYKDLSRESINIDRITGIYVPVGKADVTRRTLLSFGAESLSDRVRESTVFDYNDFR
jgi:hypothetical protein